MAKSKHPYVVFDCIDPEAAIEELKRLKIAAVNCSDDDSQAVQAAWTKRTARALYGWLGENMSSRSDVEEWKAEDAYHEVTCWDGLRRAVIKDAMRGYRDDGKPSDETQRDPFKESGWTSVPGPRGTTIYRSPAGAKVSITHLNGATRYVVDAVGRGANTTMRKIIEALAEDAAA